jgi:hypothetical protein
MKMQFNSHLEIRFQLFFSHYACKQDCSVVDGNQPGGQLMSASIRFAAENHGRPAEAKGAGGTAAWKPNALQNFTMWHEPLHCKKFWCMAQIGSFAMPASVSPCRKCALSICI